MLWSRTPVRGDCARPARTRGEGLRFTGGMGEMSDNSAISIELTTDQVIAARFLVATWGEAGTTPEVIEEDDVTQITFPTGLAGVARALEAAQAAAAHGGGLAASARDLANRLEQLLRA
jgi:hypothetical protein